MKKIYSFLMLLALTAFSVTASAKTFTITVDDQNHIGRAIITNNGSYITFTDNMAEFDTEESSYLMIEAASGYQIESVTDGGGNSLAYTPSTTVQFSLSELRDGDEIAVTTSEKEQKIFTFTGDERLTVSMYTWEAGDIQYTAENGVFTVPMPDNGYNPVTISSDIEKLAIRKVVADDGNEHYPDYGTVSIYAYEYSESTHFTIETYNPDEARTASMTVKVNGSADNVVLSRSDYTTVTLNSDGETTVKFDPENETEFSISSQNYSKPLYQVKQNGEIVEANYGSYYVTVKDGDYLEITPDFPDVDVPVTFTFTNEGTEDAISSVAVNNQYDIDWKQNDFSVKLGSSIYVRLNNDDYDITEWKVNDEIQSPYSYSYNATITSEEPLNFTITATKKAPKNITVHCDEYENIIVYALNQYWMDIESYELTEKDSQIEIPAGASYVQIKPVEDWMISYIEDANGTEYSADSYIPASAGLELFVGAKALERDRNLTVYVGDKDDDWAYRTVTLSYGNDDLEKAYTNYNELLPIGYTIIPFGAFDCPLYIFGTTEPNYSNAIIYLNDELCPFNQNTYRYEGLDDELQDGDVLKMFAAEPETYTVTYAIDDDANVEVIHDHTRTIANPTEHSVLEGTEVWIKAEATEDITVTVGEEEITAEDGVYTITVNANTTVKITVNNLTGIQNVEKNDVSNVDVYNLQGIRVGRMSDASRLPAGVYIINGKKVRF
ncbi:MAG: hypothetical protein J1E37_01800 [Prevotella sp.]|nr:hypothetical protein [Prevotella sp.]